MIRHRFTILLTALFLLLAVSPLLAVLSPHPLLTEGLVSSTLCVRNGAIGRRTEIENVLFPRGLPRVVLFIDDLDRCPPARVVEVLEATQLLVKTRLFVVVMAMVPAASAGVVFTVDPGGADGSARVEVVEGLGESLVSGQRTPDAFVIDRSGSMRKKLAKHEGATKAELVARELEATLARLEPPARFLLVAFGDEPTAFATKAVKAIKKLFEHPPANYNPMFRHHCLDALANIQGAAACDYFRKILRDEQRQIVITKLNDLIKRYCG